jgi:hypothetical protein
MWFPIVVLIAQLSAAPAPVQAAYQKLTPQELQAKKTTKKPPKDARRIDVSAKIRSASFGHKTWLWVASDGKQYWVEYGRSTNTPAALYGPFTVEAAAGSPTTPQPDTPPPAAGLPHTQPPPPQDPKLR